VNYTLASVYFVGAYLEESLQAVKIGYSYAVSSRLAALRAGNHCDLRLMAEITVEHAWRLENYYHKVFADDRFRSNGEWFRPTEPLITLIRSVTRGTWVNPIPPDPKPKAVSDGEEFEVEVEIEPPYWKSCSAGRENCKTLPDGWKKG
jgi:hypothetical protein